MPYTKGAIEIRPKGKKSLSNWIAYRETVKKAINDDLIQFNLSVTTKKKKYKKIMGDQLNLTQYLKKKKNMSSKVTYF